MNAPPAGSGPSNGPAKGTLSKVGTAVAVAAVALWVVFVVVLLFSTAAGEPQWTRLTFIFSSVQAIAFAAAGALFGVSVQQDKVQKAEKVAEENVKDATSGRALATSILADEPDRTGSDVESPVEEFGPTSPPGAQTPADQIRARHANAARSLFPDL